MSTVIDVHSHLIGERSWMPEPFWDGLVDIVVRANERSGRSVDRGELSEEYVESWLDPDGRQLLTRMDEAGIDRQVVFGLDFGVHFGDPGTPIDSVNRQLAALQDEHPDRLTAFVTVDPRREGARELVVRALDDWGMGGLKLHPTAGFHLHDSETYDLLSVAADSDVPVLTDSGPINGPLYSEYSHPRHVDEVLVDFPSLDLIVAHMSLGWWRDLHAIADMKTARNFHVDISGWQPRLDNHGEEFLRALRLFIDSLGADRVHFGTDDPAFDPTYPKEDWLATVRSLQHRPDSPTFSEDEVEMVLGEGAVPLVDG